MHYNFYTKIEVFYLLLIILEELKVAVITSKLKHNIYIYNNKIM